MDKCNSPTDEFVKLNLPDSAAQPEYLFKTEALQFPKKLNCAELLMDKNILDGNGDRTAIITEDVRWTYQKLYEISNQIAHVLIDDFGLVTGNRVLLRTANTPMAVACWLAVLKAGGIVISTMALLRAPELNTVLNKAEVRFALCDHRLKEEIQNTDTSCLMQICLFDAAGNADKGSDLEALLQNKSTEFNAVDTKANDPALIAFTSGTTGEPKGTVHFHRDVMAMCICAADNLLKPNKDDIFIGSPPMAFTFGLGMLVTFPLHIGAASVLLENPDPINLMIAIEKYKATICATAPTAYKVMLKNYSDYDISSLTKAVSSGEHLPAQVCKEWYSKTGQKIINALGSTEMTHMFISSVGNDIRSGRIGKAIDGYEVCILGDDNLPVETGSKGRLAVKGPTGCKYLDDIRQQNYVVNGWNITGDICSLDKDGYVRVESRGDDMIISSGYNIAGSEVEDALHINDKVSACAVIGVPNEKRGSIVKAYIVLSDNNKPSDKLLLELQNHTKQAIAPYKYPREIEFVEALPRTRTGKVQRQKLRELNKLNGTE